MTVLQTTSYRKSYVERNLKQFEPVFHLCHLVFTILLLKAPPLIPMLQLEKSNRTTLFHMFSFGVMYNMAMLNIQFRLNQG